MQTAIKITHLICNLQKCKNIKYICKPHLIYLKSIGGKNCKV